jgi:hypothetical protein
LAISVPNPVADFPVTSGGIGLTLQDCPAGNLVIVLPYPDNLNGTITNVTDSVGNTYIKAVGTTTAAGLFTASIWYCINNVHMPIGTTITISGSPNAIDMTVYYVSGANGGLDATSVNSTTLASAATTLTLSTPSTLAVADNIIIASCLPSNGPSSPTATGWTVYDTAYGYYKIVSSTAQQTFTPVWSGSARATATIAAFKATAVASVIKVSTLLMMGI